MLPSKSTTPLMGRCALPGSSMCRHKPFPNHSHSIINRSRKPAWLKGSVVIDLVITVAFTVKRTHLLLA